MFASNHRDARIGGRLYALATAFLVVAATLTAAAPAAAQQFKEMKPQISVKKSKSMRLIVVKALLRDPSVFQANRQIFDSYFMKFYFPYMTVPSNAGQLEKLRENLFKQFIRPARVQAAQEHLTNLTLKAMRVIARDNYHPAARYNAVLILGMLDEKVAGIGANPRPPIPLPAAASELLDLLEQDEFNQVKVPASVKIGALVGLERHARFGIDAQYADRLTKAALAVIAQEEPPADLDADVHHWMRCQAAAVLARQYAKGPNAQVHAALTGMIADGNLGLEDRCCVAALLKGMNYKGATEIDGAAAVAALGDLMKSVASDEAEKARDFQQAMLGGRLGRGDAEPTYERRRLVARLRSISGGANSLAKGLDDAARQQLQGLLGPLAPVLAVALDKNSLDLDIAPKVIELEGAINRIVDSWQKPAMEAARPAEGDVS